jgi:type IV pilus assembly protein PilE
VTVKAKMTEAKMMLRQVHALEQSYYFEYDRYTQDLAALGFEQTKLVSDGGTARYRIGVESLQDGGFIATATSTVDFDNDGQYNVWQVDQEGVISMREPD